MIKALPRHTFADLRKATFTMPVDLDGAVRRRLALAYAADPVFDLPIDLSFLVQHKPSAAEVAQAHPAIKGSPVNNHWTGRLGHTLATYSDWQRKVIAGHAARSSESLTNPSDEYNDFQRALNWMITSGPANCLRPASLGELSRVARVVGTDRGAKGATSVLAVSPLASQFQQLDEFIQDLDSRAAAVFSAGDDALGWTEPADLSHSQEAYTGRYLLANRNFLVRRSPFTANDPVDTVGARPRAFKPFSHPVNGEAFMERLREIRNMGYAPFAQLGVLNGADGLELSVTPNWGQEHASRLGQAPKSRFIAPSPFSNHNDSGAYYSDTPPLGCSLLAGFDDLVYLQFLRDLPKIVAFNWISQEFLGISEKELFKTRQIREVSQGLQLASIPLVFNLLRVAFMDCVFEMFLRDPLVNESIAKRLPVDAQKQLAEAGAPLRKLRLPPIFNDLLREFAPTSFNGETHINTEVMDVTCRRVLPTLMPVFTASRALKDPMPDPRALEVGRDRMGGKLYLDPSSMFPSTRDLSRIGHQRTYASGANDLLAGTGKRGADPADVARFTIGAMIANRLWLRDLIEPPGADPQAFQPAALRTWNKLGELCGWTAELPTSRGAELLGTVIRVTDGIAMSEPDDDMFKIIDSPAVEMHASYGFPALGTKKRIRPDSTADWRAAVSADSAWVTENGLSQFDSGWIFDSQFLLIPTSQGKLRPTHSTLPIDPLAYAPIQSMVKLSRLRGCGVDFVTVPNQAAHWARLCRMPVIEWFERVLKDPEQWKHLGTVTTRPDGSYEWVSVKDGDMAVTSTLLRTRAFSQRVCFGSGLPDVAIVESGGSLVGYFNYDPLYFLRDVVEPANMVDLALPRSAQVSITRLGFDRGVELVTG